MIVCQNKTIVRNNEPTPSANTSFLVLVDFGNCENPDHRLLLLGADLGVENPHLSKEAEE